MQKHTRLCLPIGVFIGIFLLLSSCGVSKRTQAYRSNLESLTVESRKYLGTPYKYGGTTHKGIDCSGLICNTYKAIDITLPRTSADQSKVGKKVKVKKLRTGDLLFFAMSDRRRKITHVGMVTEVSRDKVMFIHASSSVGVVERDLLQEYYIKRLRKARRVVSR